MGRIAALIENFFDGQALRHYENSLRLREALVVLEEKYEFELVNWFDAQPSSGRFDPDRDPSFRQVLLEANKRRGFKRVHIAYRPSGIVMERLLESCISEEKDAFTRYTYDIELIRSRPYRVDQFVDEFLFRSEWLLSRQEVNR